MSVFNEPIRAAFINAWGASGYRENWTVYGAQSGVTEQTLIDICLRPFLNPKHVALEIGCGGGFWTEKYLSPGFLRVIALDLIPDPKLKGDNITYIEVPDRNYDCCGVMDNSVDFIWSFGVFCHLRIDSVQHYLDSAFRVLRPGCSAVLYFSNTERRPGSASGGNQPNEIVWTPNNWKSTKSMMERAGFVEVTDLMPQLCDTIAHAKKPT